MTAKEKALELCVKFFKSSVFDYEEKQCLVDEENAKQCALICVDEIINTGVNQDYIEQDGYMLSLVEFYAEVKEEINKLWLQKQKTDTLKE